MGSPAAEPAARRLSYINDTGPAIASSVSTQRSK
jgi:hypothetical protein